MATTTIPATRTPSARVHSVMNSVKDFTPHEKCELVIMLVESMDEPVAPTSTTPPTAKEDPVWKFCGALADYGTAEEFMQVIREGRSTLAREFDI